MLTRLVAVVAPLLSAILVAAAPAAAQSPIPQLALWEAQMLSYGQTHCVLGALDEVYYDAERVYYQIADYTGNPAWITCAHLAQTVYRDQYVLPNSGGVPGYWNFTTGLRIDYQRTGDPQSKNAALLLSQNGAFAPDSTPLAWTASADASREVAYAILSHINAQLLGQPLRQRRIDLVNQAYEHMNQWFVNFSWPGPWQLTPQTTIRLAPFMVGLTAHSLIRDWEETQDPRLIPALRLAADWLWANAWIPSAQAMWYEFPDAGQPCCHASAATADLNLLVAPLYAFLYWQTGDTKYRDEGDQLFAGGAQFAWLAGGKQFDQNYWWSFDYVKWRGGGAPPPPPPPPPPPTGTLQVAITQPTNGTSVSGIPWAVIWINGATGAANTVTLTLGGRTVGTTTSATSGPISLPYDTRLAADGPQTLTAAVRDASGNTGAGGVSVTVQNGTAPPPTPVPLTTSITTPAAGATVSGTTTVTMAASGGTAPYTYTLALDGITLVSSAGATYAWNTTATSDASHTLTLTARDSAGTTATAAQTVTVSNGVSPPPSSGSLQVFVTQPRNATTVQGTAWIVVWLNGAQGAANAYTVTVNGQAVATQTTSSTGPVSLPWVTLATPNGAQTLSVAVRDATGNTGTASVTVTVAN